MLDQERGNNSGMDYGSIGAMVEEVLEEVAQREESQVGDRRPHFAKDRKNHEKMRHGWEVCRACAVCGKKEWIREAVAGSPEYTGTCLSCRAKRSFAIVNQSKRGKDYRGEKCCNWRGGTYIDSQGYTHVLITPDHPYYAMGHKLKNRTSVYVLEHRLVMAQFIGRCLTKKEVVHHIDGDRKRNILDNLCLTTRIGHLPKTFNVMNENFMLKARIQELESEVESWRQWVFR